MIAVTARYGCSCTARTEAKIGLHPSEQDRPNVARRRARWKRHPPRVDARRLVIIDETWVKTNMASLRGWCRRGKRLMCKAPHGPLAYSDLSRCAAR